MCLVIYFIVSLSVGSNVFCIKNRRNKLHFMVLDTILKCLLIWSSNSNESCHILFLVWPNQGAFSFFCLNFFYLGGSWVLSFEPIYFPMHFQKILVIIYRIQGICLFGYISSNYKSEGFVEARFIDVPTDLYEETIQCKN